MCVPRSARDNSSLQFFQSEKAFRTIFLYTVRSLTVSKPDLLSQSVSIVRHWLMDKKVIVEERAKKFCDFLPFPLSSLFFNRKLVV